jgi:hypothetical protein
MTETDEEFLKRMEGRHQEEREYGPDEYALGLCDDEMARLLKLARRGLTARERTAISTSTTFHNVQDKKP